MSSLPRLGVLVVEFLKSSFPDMPAKARFRVSVGGAGASAVVVVVSRKCLA